MEYTIPFEDAMPARWRRAHNELSPPSSPAVDTGAASAHTGARVVKHGTRMIPGTAVKPAQDRATKALTPPTSTESSRTTAVRPLDPAVVKAAASAARDEDARDGDRSSTSSPVPRSSPTPATGSSTLPLPGSVTPPPSQRYQPAKRRAAAIPAPIRDTPNNPFIEGGPADLGFRGPFGADARKVADARAASRMQRGRTTYVFRGQRITYEDPDYISGDSDSDGLFGPNGLQPRLLFPARTPPRASSSGSSSHSRTRQNVAQSSSARLAASLAAHERQLGSSASRPQPTASSSSTATTTKTTTHRDEKGIDIDTYFGPSEPLSLSRPTSVERRAVVHADAGHLLHHCDSWSSDASDDEAGHAGFSSLDRVRMDMDHLVAVGEHPSASSGSIAMSRRTSSRSSSASSRSARSTRIIQGAGTKRKAHPFWNRELEARGGESRSTSLGLDGDDVASDSTGHTFGISRISLAAEQQQQQGPAKRSRLAGPEHGASASVQGGFFGLGLGEVERMQDMHGAQK
ncbi:hypothetical protein OC844_000661 [Tilletia horrida]|nr:hypothetical protein OC844_000661 [Tilletia horrida]